jgi:hypothetical protein
MRTSKLAAGFLATLALSVAAGGAPRAAGGPLEVMVALDNSGSMQRSDPQRMMPEVVKGFAAQLETGARLGVVIFGAGAEVVLELGEAARPGFAAQLEEALQRLTYGAAHTDIAAGVERGLYELREHGRAEADRALVVLSDGYVDLGSRERSAERAAWLRNHLTAEAKRHGIRLFGVAFTDGADFGLLQALGERTRGSYFRVLKIADMPRVFEGVRAALEKIARGEAAAAAPQRVVIEPPVAVEWPVSGPVVAGVAGGLVALVGLAALVMQRRRAVVAPLRMPAAKLRELGGSGKVYTLRRAVTRIGRAKDNDIVVAAETVSAHHAAIEWRDGAFYVKDLGSTNGTRKNGVCFSERERMRAVRLKHRDRVAFDACVFEFLLAAAEDMPETQLGELAPAGDTVVHAATARASAADQGSSAAAAQVAANQATGEKCRNHPRFDATERCRECGRMCCEWCVTEKNGGTVCLGCAREVA